MDDVLLAVTIVSIILAIFFGINAFLNRQKDTSETDNKRREEIRKEESRHREEVQYMSGVRDETLKRIEVGMNVLIGETKTHRAMCETRFDTLDGRITKIDESVRSAHKRINDISVNRENIDKMNVAIVKNRQRLDDIAEGLIEEGGNLK